MERLLGEGIGSSKDTVEGPITKSNVEDWWGKGICVGEEGVELRGREL